MLVGSLSNVFRVRNSRRRSAHKVLNELVTLYAPIETGRDGLSMDTSLQYCIKESEACHRVLGLFHAEIGRPRPDFDALGRGRARSAGPVTNQKQERGAGAPRVVIHCVFVFRLCLL